MIMGNKKKENFKKNKIIRVNKTAIHEYQSKRRTSNVLYETIYSIVVFKLDVFFVLLM